MSSQTFFQWLKVDPKTRMAQLNQLPDITVGMYASYEAIEACQKLGIPTKFVNAAFNTRSLDGEYPGDHSLEIISYFIRQQKNLKWHNFTNFKGRSVLLEAIYNYYTELNYGDLESYLSMGRRLFDAFSAVDLPKSLKVDQADFNPGNVIFTHALVGDSLMIHTDHELINLAKHCTLNGIRHLAKCGRSTITEALDVCRQLYGDHRKCDSLNQLHELHQTIIDEAIARSLKSDKQALIQHTFGESFETICAEHGWRPFHTGREMIVRGNEHNVCIGGDWYRERQFKNNKDQTQFRLCIYNDEAQAELNFRTEGSKIDRCEIIQCKTKYNKNYDETAVRAIAKAAVGCPVKDFIAREVA